MLNVEHVLLRNHIRMTNVAFAVADASNLVRDSSNPLYTATKLFNDVLSIVVVFTDVVQARIAVKHMIRDVLVYKCKIDNDDIPDMVEDAVEYANKFCADPTNAYLLAKPEVESQEVVQVVDGLDTKVAVNADGVIKRGGKKILAIELYDKYVKKSSDPLTRQSFIELLVKEVGLKFQAASTYHYNISHQIQGWTQQN